MNDNERRNIAEFYAHRTIVLERIKHALAQEKKK